MRPTVLADFAVIERAAENVTAYRHLASLDHGPWGRTVERDGLVIGCTGLIDCGAGAALTWALVAREAGLSLLGCCRAYRAFLASTGFWWIEAHVAPGFAVSERLVTMIGFRPLGVQIAMPSGPVFDRWVLRR